MIEELDDIDREAMREGFAIKRLHDYSGGRRRQVIVKGNERKSIEKAEDVDILRILNIIQGQRK